MKCPAGGDYCGPEREFIAPPRWELYFIDATVKDIASPRGGLRIGRRRSLTVEVVTGSFEADNVEGEAEAEHKNVEVEKESIGQSPRAASVCVVGDNRTDAPVYPWRDEGAFL